MEPPHQGQVQPDDFISIAEKTGQIRALTEWMLRQPIVDQARLADNGQVIDIFVNISAPLLGDVDFADTLLRFVEGRKGAIGLEITETAIIDDPQSTLAHLNRFVDAGLKVAIDDYGAGWSSLSYLKQLPAHELKIDRAFISDISRSHRDPLFMACDLIQGFLVSPPLTLGALSAFLKDEDSLTHLDRMSVGFGAKAGAGIPSRTIMSVNRVS